ncbi:CAX1 [Auxenochlorella protothecoides x Auxenochlorella symbiontica]
MDISRRQLHLVSADAARRSGVDGADQEGNLSLSTSLRSPRLSSRSRASGHLEEPLLDPEAAAEAGESPAGNGALPPHQPPRGAHNSERARRHWRFAASHVSKLMPDNFANSDSDTASILSERRLARRGGDRSRDAIAQTFISTLAGTLGTGTVLQNQSIAMEHHPGVWSPGSDARCIGLMLVSSYINVLLACIPVGILAGALGWSPTLVFIMNFLALVPLALLLGETTEDLAVRFGDTVGGLLNATFGNVVELILSIAALRKGLYTVVATSLIGSILSNLLLVLGMCFLFGGLRFQQQRFSPLANKVGSSLLFVACIGIIIPTMAKRIYGSEVMTDAAVINLSHAIAILLMFVYFCYLTFQLKTHSDLFASGESEDNPALSLSGALAFLSAITVIVAVCSEFLTGAIEAVSEKFNINPSFLGLIVLPIAGNACEHITAVFVAFKNKMDLAIGVAVGSSIQIALFAIPFTVLAGWVMGTTFTLDFDVFSVLMLTVAVILAYFVSSDGSSNWLLGLQLIITYVLIAAVFFLEREPKHKSGGH